MVFGVVSVSLSGIVTAESDRFCDDDNNGVAVDDDDEITTNSFVVDFVVSVICKRGWMLPLPPPVQLFNCILKLFLLAEVEWYSML